jgi:hypothetical protein
MSTGWVDNGAVGFKLNAEAAAAANDAMDVVNGAALFSAFAASLFSSSDDSTTVSGF